MPVTININGLSLAHKGSSGMAIATVPDVCKTPSPGGPVPIPYPNIAMSSSLAEGSTTVKADGGQMIAVKGSEFSMSSGDDAGTAGGVASSTFKKEAKWITYSFNVKIEGKNACRLTDKMTMNHGNTVCMAGEIQPPVVVPPAKDPGEKDDDNWIELEYLYNDGSGIANAKYVVANLEGKELKSGTLDQNGYAKVRGLPAGVDQVLVYFDDDPQSFEIAVEHQPKAHGKELPSPNYVRESEDSIKDLGNWVWGVVIGDFNENPSMSQIAVRAAITMVPVVDQAADITDIVANLKFLIWDKRYDEYEVWVVLFITIIGCIPVLGSAAKGILRAIYFSLKRGRKVDLGKLLRHLNFFGKGNAVRWLKEFLADFRKHMDEVTRILTDILNDISAKLTEILEIFNKYRRLIPDRIYDLVLEMLQNVKEVLKKLPRMARRFYQEMSNSIEKVIRGSGRVASRNKTNGRRCSKQLKEKPPEPRRGRRAGREFDKAGKEFEKSVRTASGGKKKIVQGVEFDSVTDEALIEAKATNITKPKNFLSKKTRDQIKRHIKISKDEGKRYEMWFKNDPPQEVKDYLEKKGVKIVIQN